MQVLPEIVRLAEAGRVVRLGYRRPGDASVSEYAVEPYSLHHGHAGPGLRAWNLGSGPAGGTPGWRDFRLDRIVSVADAGSAFSPRVPVSIGRDAPVEDPSAAGTQFKGFGERPIARMGDAEDYFRQIETAMLDGKISEEEMTLAQGLRDRVEIHERKAAHARVFASVLHEVLQDGRITHREELYLANVRAFLDRLGWAP
jgi:hypothetical protein